MNNQDPLILAVENWLNNNYSDNPAFGYLEPEGRPGNTVVGRLIMALQIELGISNPVPTFGPATEAAFQNMSRNQFDEGERYNLVYILQGAFWAKGYSPGTFDGRFNSTTEFAVQNFQSDVGFENTSGVVDVKLMKALLNTDGFRLSTTGSPIIRNIQQILNTEYAGGYFDYIPTNGVYERQTNRALIFALQIEIGLGNVANGSYGPATITNTPTLTPGNSQTRANRVLQFALAVNGYSGGTFNGEYSSIVEDEVRSFQAFMTLPATGIANMPTIKQLLTSNGYVERSAVACDASMIINSSTASTLEQNGYEIIGRYLTGTVAGLRSKAMTFDELSILQGRGIKVFPIYQDGGSYASYFNADQGSADAKEAITETYRLGFPEGTTIYFAVDFDVYDYQISQLIIPYMTSAREIFDANSSNPNMPSYELGVYGPRNVCIRCAEEPTIHTEYSFVANMSTGFSGNLGFPMPENWSFGQFFETSVGSGSGYLEIDKNDYSGRDNGASTFNPIFENRDEEEEMLFDHWKEIISVFPFLNLDLSLISAGFEFNESFTIFDNALSRLEVETEVGYTTPAQGNSVRVNILNGEIEGNIETIFSEEYSSTTTFGLGELVDTINSISVAVDNGFVDLGFEITNDEIRFTVSMYKEEIEGPEGTINLAVKVIYAVKLYYPSFTRPQIEFLFAVVGVTGSIAAGILIAKFLTPAVVLGGAGAMLLALIAYLGDIFNGDDSV